MAIVFFGTPDFAVPTLRSLIDSGEDTALVVSQPDRPKGRGRQISPTPVKALALTNRIPVLQPHKLHEIRETLAKIEPEFLVVVAYGKILPKDILEIPKRGAINVHASLLPRYRGAAPIQWALLNGDSTTGVTTMLMDEGLDTGDILLKAEVPIAIEDNALSLSERLSVLGSRLLLETLQGLRKGLITPVPQSGEPCYAPPIRPEQGRIDWQRPAREIANLVRGLYLWPQAYCYLGNERLKVFKAQAIEGTGVAGRIEAIEGGNIIVGCANGLLKIEELQAEGKRRLATRDFLSGRRLRPKDDYLS